MELNSHPLLILVFTTLLISHSSTAQLLTPSSAPSPSPATSDLTPSSSPSISPAASDLTPSSSPSLSPAYSQISLSPSDSQSSPSPSPAYSEISQTPATSPSALAPESAGYDEVEGPTADITTAPEVSAAVSGPTPGDVEHVSFVIGSYVKKAASDAQAALEILEKSAHDSSISTMEGECFNQCVDNYMAITEDFKKALAHVDAGNYYMLTEDLSAVSTDVDACEDCFKEMTGAPSPLEKFEGSIKAASTGGLGFLQLAN